MDLKRPFFRILALCYAVGFVMHVLDLFDLRLRFSEMTSLWKAWVAYLTIFDLIAVVGLWRFQVWGIAAFLLVAVSQLVAYAGFPDLFGEQTFLVWFHALSIAGSGIVTLIGRRYSSP